MAAGLVHPVSSACVETGPFFVEAPLRVLKWRLAAALAASQ